MNVKNVNKQKRNTLSRQERPSIMKKFFILVLALSVSALAEPTLNERVDGLQAQIDRAIAKAGIHFSGEFRSQFLSSTVSGDAVDEDNKKNESVEYTSVDFDIVARPNTALSARAMFRLHQDWRNFFSDLQNPIVTRWISIDGSFMQGIFTYNMGDYKKKLTPLTLWSPDLELLYEPEIFAQNRRLAMEEVFLGDNNRLLQGMNIAFDAELYPILHNVSADFFGARLAAAGTGESNITAPSQGVFDARYDKYLVGADIGVQGLEGVGGGVGFVSIFDHAASMNMADGLSRPNNMRAEDFAKLGTQATNVISGRLNFDNRVFMEDDFIRVGLKGEYALSSDRRYNVITEVRNEIDSLGLKDSIISGTALNLEVFTRVNLGEGNELRLSVGHISNERNFRNDAAQSPTFFQQSVMNSENSLLGLGMMNPFDALYRNVFKYAPSQYHAGPDPYAKNAYNIAILTPEEVANLSGDGKFVYPNVFQAALPGGIATANREGRIVRLCGSFLENALTVGVKAALLKTPEDAVRIDNLDPDGYIDPTAVVYTADFTEIVAGASVDVAKFVPVVGPSLVISGSYGMYNTTANITKVGDLEIDIEDVSESNLISFGLDWNFWQRFSFLVGYQQLTTNLKATNVVENKLDETGTFTFSNLAFGLNYKVADGGSLTFKVSMLNGEGNDIAMGGEAKSYSVMQPELFLTVRF